MNQRKAGARTAIAAPPMRSLMVSSSMKSPYRRKPRKAASLSMYSRIKYMPMMNQIALTANSIVFSSKTLNMISASSDGKMNKTGNLLFGENRKRRQRKPFRGLHLLFGSHHSEVSGMQATVACKDPVAPVALMTSGSFDCAAAGLRESVTPPRKAHRSLGTSSVYLDLDPMPLGDCEDPVFHLDCVRPAGHNAQAIFVAENSIPSPVNLRKGLPGFSFMQSGQ